MKDDKVKKLALALLTSESEERVIEVLRAHSLWDDKALWRLYGDKEGNFAQAGNQQSLPEAALVEKIINCVDARLTSECLQRRIDPEAADAPTSIRDAVAMFFEHRRATDDEAGTLANWAPAKRTAQSRAITVAATGDRPTRGHGTRKMCITIVDQGEGQSPDRLPHTILSLNAKNKQRIRFVQGKFNMGGSGALRFCGKYGIQLVISRRCPALAALEAESDITADLWGVTVVRREQPSDKSGEPVHSEFTYLAPLGAEATPRRGGVLRFKADALPLMPEYDDPYARKVDWATVIKLYEYDTDTGQSNILMKDGLLFALERLMPEIALPVRLHECRGYKGVKERSFETPLAGLVVRLEEGRGDNLEPGFPLSAKLRAGGMSMTARIYAFKEDRAGTYLKNEGVIFSINGQAHGNLPKSLFSRPKAVGLPRLKDSLLVIMDCSTLTAVQREDLFMSSRDRLSKRPIRNELESEIEELLRNNSELRRLQQERRAADVESKLSDEKPFEEVLRRVLKSSPALKALFLAGQRLPRPFAKGGGAKVGASTGPKGEREDFNGLRHPTYFRIPKHEYGKEYERNCELDRRFRVKFETDVENGYFDRPTDRGAFGLEITASSREVSAPSFSVTLEDGIASLSVALPPEMEVGDYLQVTATVTDSTLPAAFINVIRLTAMQKQARPSGDKRDRAPRAGGGAGDSPSREGITLPHVIPVREGDAHWIKHKFDADTACHVITDPVDENGKRRYDHTFYVNVDNRALQTEMKYSKQDARLLEAKFKYGSVLLGVAMLHEIYGRDGRPSNATSDGADGEEGRLLVEDRIRQVTRAVAPVLIPMIDQLSGLSEKELDVLSEAGEDD